jgi:hypothetical protein
MTCVDKHGLKQQLGRALAGDADAWSNFSVRSASRIGRIS